MENIEAKIASIQTLNDLCDLLNEIQSAQSEGDDEARWFLESNALCELPTFGGEFPDTGDTVWSWDTSNYLTTTNEGAGTEWVVMPR